MNILSLKKLVLFGTLLYIPCQSMAWGMLGHRVVGQVAESYLSKKAKHENTKHIKRFLNYRKSRREMYIAKWSP